MIGKVIGNLIVKMFTPILLPLKKLPKVQRIIIACIITFIVTSVMTIFFLAASQFIREVGPAAVEAGVGISKAAVKGYYSFVADTKEEARIYGYYYNFEKEAFSMIWRDRLRYNLEKKFGFERNNFILRFLTWRSDQYYKRLKQKIPKDDLLWVYFWYMHELSFLIFDNNNEITDIKQLHENIGKFLEALQLLSELSTEVEEIRDKKFLCVSNILANLTSSILKDPENYYSWAGKGYFYSCIFLKQIFDKKNENPDLLNQYIYLKVSNTMIFTLLNYENAACRSNMFYKIQDKIQETQKLLLKVREEAGTILPSYKESLKSLVKGLKLFYQSKCRTHFFD